MLANLNEFILSRALQLALRRPAPNLIPRSMPRADAIDCYVATLSGSKEEWSVLVDSQTSQTVNGRWLNGDTYEGAVTLLPEAIHASKFECTHFLGPYEFKYDKPLKFILHQWLRLPHVAVLRDRLEQFQFNRQHLVRRDRIDILRYVYEASLETPSQGVSSISLAASLYTNRIYFHPDKTRMLNHCRLLLDSLVASGDLNSVDAAYTIAPPALKTLSQHEEDDRRHRDMLSQQRALKWLTFALIGVGLLQAYVSWAK